MGILDEGESAEVNSLLNFVNNPKKGDIHDWAKSTGKSMQTVLPIVRGPIGAIHSWVEALKEVWDNEEPMIVIRNDGEYIQIHEIFGWNESNLGLTGSQKEVDYNWVSIDVSPERAKNIRN